MGIIDDGMNSQRAARGWPLRAADRRRIKGYLFPFGIKCANGCFGLVHHDFRNLLLRRLRRENIRHQDFRSGGFERRLRIEPRQQGRVDVEFLGEQFARAGEVEGLQLRLLSQSVWDGLVERALNVRRLDFILDEDGFGRCRREPVPGWSVEVAARIDPVCILKRGDGL